MLNANAPSSILEPVPIKIVMQRGFGCIHQLSKSFLISVLTVTIVLQSTNCYIKLCEVQGSRAPAAAKIASVGKPSHVLGVVVHRRGHAVVQDRFPDLIAPVVLQFVIG